MKILVTGAGGFLGKNLIAALKAGYGEEHIIITYDKSNTLEELKRDTMECDFVYHFAAVHRSVEEAGFMEANYELLYTLLEFLRENDNRCPVLYTSTVQATQDTAYAISKRMAEDALREHEMKNNSKGIIYRLTNTFGKWAEPYAYSVVATFCSSIARNMEIEIQNPDMVMNFYYIDDVIDTFLRHLKEEVLPCGDGYYRLKEEYCYHVTLQELADMIKGFQKAREELYIPDIRSSFARKLYSTYLSYLPLEELTTPINP